MQNEFEKQVREKMEELKLVPGEPVWENIEKQIREKKERRRIFLWLPLLFALLGAGILWINYANHTASYTPPPAAKQGINNKTKHAPVTVKEREHNATEISQTPAETTEGQTIVPGHKTPDNEVAIKMNQNAGQGTKSKKATEKRGISRNMPLATVAPSQKTVRRQIKSSQHDRRAVNHRNGRPESLVQKNTSDLPGLEKKEEINEKASTSGHEETVLPGKKIPTTANHSKWQLGIVADLGFSDIHHGLNLFGGAKSLSYSPSAQNGSSGASSPSPVKKDLAFTIGLRVQKKISKRLSLTTGLQYQYFSTRIGIGKSTRSDTIINGTRYNFYYSDPSLLSVGSGSSANASVVSGNYINRYHFIALPVMINIQLARKKPLYLDIGFSLQRLIATSALTYNDYSQVYLQDKNAFRKMQLFGGAGINYAVIQNKKIAVIAGPQLQYGLSSLGKGSSDDYLFSFGLHTKILFTKN